MSTSLPPVDLLRERRVELGLPPDTTPPLDTRRLLLIGAAVGGGLVVAMVAVTLLLRLQQEMLSRELARLAPVREQVAKLEQELAAEKAANEKTRASNKALAGGLVTLRSGSALMTDLSLRTPRGLQLTGLTVGKEALELKGRSADPGAFERIKALVLQLKGSPLLDPAKITLARAGRPSASGTGPAAPEANLVAFEISAGFRASAESLNQRLALLQSLGAEGLALRLQTLRREGVLP